MSDVSDYCNNHKDNFDTILITGFSQGGALSYMCFPHIKSLFPDIKT